MSVLLFIIDLSEKKEFKLERRGAARRTRHALGKQVYAAVPRLTGRGTSLSLLRTGHSTAQWAAGDGVVAPLTSFQESASDQVEQPNNKKLFFFSHRRILRPVLPAVTQQEQTAAAWISDRNPIKKSWGIFSYPWFSLCMKIDQWPVF